MCSQHIKPAQNYNKSMQNKNVYLFFKYFQKGKNEGSHMQK